MAINKKLIHFQTLENFNTQLSAGNILDTSICFIKDAKKIWTHGEFYDCSENEAIDTSKFVDLSANVTNLAEDDLILHATDILDLRARGGSALLQSRNSHTYIQADGNIYLQPNYYAETEGKVLYNNVEVATKNDIPDTSTLMQLGSNTTDQAVSLDASSIELTANNGNINLSIAPSSEIEEPFIFDIEINASNGNNPLIESNVNISASNDVNINAGETLNITVDNKDISIGTDIQVNANSGNIELNAASVLVNDKEIATIDDLPATDNFLVKGDNSTTNTGVSITVNTDNSGEYSQLSIQPTQATLKGTSGATLSNVYEGDVTVTTYPGQDGAVNINGYSGVNINTEQDADVYISGGYVNVEAVTSFSVFADTGSTGLSIDSNVELFAGSGNLYLNGGNVFVNGNDLSKIPVYRLTITPTLSTTANAGTYQYPISSCTIDSDTAANVYNKLVACANSGIPVYVNYGSTSWRWFMGSCQIPASGQVLLEYWVPSGMHCQLIFTSSGFRNGNCWHFRKHLTTPVVTQTATSVAIAPNVYNVWSGTYSSLTITLTTASDSTIVNEYMAQFTTSSSGCTLTLPSTIKWANGEAPTIEASKTYQLSIINNLAVIAVFS